ncbi:MAG: hypothetical protein K2Y56_07720 [Methylobacterium sp.]|uniref:hypothetical protein n=1 Tax=Methylobacterium sp. TaxID=409 RepID=UPI0025F79085|nr:hypothetical protein [Methylobacterium sp.]MBX9931412.1 hypothetical protein [Methylobacterium sp.]
MPDRPPKAEKGSRPGAIESLLLILSMGWLFAIIAADGKPRLAPPSTDIAAATR